MPHRRINTKSTSTAGRDAARGHELISNRRGYKASCMPQFVLTLVAADRRQSWNSSGKSQYKLLPFQPAVPQQRDWYYTCFAERTCSFRSNLIVVGSGAGARVASMAKSIHFCLIACSEPTTLKTSSAKPHDEIGALTSITDRLKKVPIKVLLLQLLRKIQYLVYRLYARSKLRFARIPPRIVSPGTGQPRQFDEMQQIKGMRGSEERYILIY